MHILQLMISLSSDEVMLVASTFLESTPWLLVTWLEPLSLRRPCSGDCRWDCITDAQRCCIHSMIGVVKLNKNCT